MSASQLGFIDNNTPLGYHIILLVNLYNQGMKQLSESLILKLFFITVLHTYISLSMVYLIVGINKEMYGFCKNTPG